MNEITTVLASPRISWYTGGGERIPMQQAYHLALKGSLVELVTRKVPFAMCSPLYLDFLERNARLTRPVRVHEIKLPANVETYLKDDPEHNQQVWPTESFAFSSAAALTIRELWPNNVMNYFSLDGLFKLHNGNNFVYLLGNPPYTLQNGAAMIRMYDHVLAISREVQNHWSQYMGNNKPDLLHTGVDIPEIKDLEHRDPTNIILYAGRLIERKGVDILLKSFVNIWEDFNTARLIIAGDGPEKENLERMTGEFGLQEQVQFMGTIGPQELQALYNLADMCIFPSREGEGLMGVVLESMASGKPVITTENNGNEDVISNGIDGFLIPPDDVQTLTARVELLFGNPDLARQIGLRARTRINDNFTWEKHTEKLMALFQALKPSNYEP